MLGTVLAAVIVVLVASGPSTGVVRFNVILVPVLMLPCAGWGQGLGQALKYSHVPTWKAAVNPYVTHWWMAALIYPAYNIFLAIQAKQ